MTRRIGPRSQRLLQAWANTISDYRSGTDYDLTHPTSTERCCELLGAFCDDPTEEHFSSFWSPSSIHTAGLWDGAIVRAGFDGDLPELAGLFEEIRSATEYDPGWQKQFPVNSGVWEVYARTHSEIPYIPTTYANDALKKFNQKGGTSYESTIEAIDRFATVYRDEIGHVTATAENSVPFRDELAEFFRLVATVDREDFAAEVTGPQGELYRSLYGYEGSLSGDQSGLITPYRDAMWPAIEGHIDARERDAYDDRHETRHWGGTHIETWKWDFAEYVAEEIKPVFDLSSLTPDEIGPFFEKWNASSTAYGGRIVQETPKKMMSRYGKDKYTYACDYCLEHPEEAAEALSTLFDQEVHVETRLEQFGTFLPDEIISAGSKMRFTSSLLMFVYPQEFITFQYERFNRFFSEYTSEDSLKQGYDPREYYRVVLTCRTIRDWLSEVLEDASMLDVHTLIWVDYNA